MADEKDKDVNKLSDEVIEIFKKEGKNLKTLSTFLKTSIATLVYGTNKNDFKRCICTLSDGLIKLYCKKLNTPYSDVSRYTNKKYSDSDSKIVVYDLVEGRRATINLADKKWGVATYLLLSNENAETITEFIKRTWPKVTTSTQKKQAKNL